MTSSQLAEWGRAMISVAVPAEHESPPRRRPDQAGQELFPRHLLSRLQIDGALPQELSGKNPLDRPGQGGDHDSTFPLQKPEEGMQPLTGELGHRGRLLEGGGVPRGKEEEFLAIAGIEEELPVKGLGALTVGGDDQEPSLHQGKKPGQQPCRGRSLEPGDHTTPPLGGKGAGNAPELIRKSGG